MPDREKVIRALEDFNKNRICLPHLIPWDEITSAIALLKEQEDMGKELIDAIELVHKKNARIIELKDLLKEQEAVEPKCNASGGWLETKDLWYCGNCGRRISKFKNRTNYCPNCGKPVLWEGR